MKKQKDGRYHTSVRVGVGTDGKPVVKWVSANTIRELNAKKDEIKRVYILPATSLGRDVLVGTYLQNWYEIYKRDNLAAGTRKTYVSTINKHIMPVIGERRMASISADDLQRLLNLRSGSSKTSICDERNILRAIFSKATAEGVIDRDPSAALILPKMKKRDKRRALTEAEAAAALKVGWSHNEGLFLLLLYYTSARPGEALGLQWRDIDFKRGCVCFHRDIDYAANAIGELKTEGSEREVPLTAELRRALWPRRGVGNAFIVQSENGSYIPQSTYKRMWRRLQEAMYEADPSIEAQTVREIKEWQLVEGKKKRVAVPVMGSILTAYYFRHNYATTLYYAGVDLLTAQEYMGHTDVKTTLQIYTHLKKEGEAIEAEKAYKRFFE